MSLWTRIARTFFHHQLNREIDEELASHIREAIDHGRDPEDVRKAFGSALRHRERSRDIRIHPWLDSLCADAVFGCRQLKKRKIASAAAILSLALAIGSCTSAFRLVDALLLRPLPIQAPERLYAVSFQGIFFDGKFQTDDGCMYPMFQTIRDAIADDATSLAISYAERANLTYGSDQQAEQAYLQYVSAGMFHSFGLQPALGRLLGESDDLKPGAHPVAVLSYDYWTRRFGKDPGTLGRTFRLGNSLYTIVGIAAEGFTGTEPGRFVDLFLPAMMHPNVERSDVNWFRTLVRLRPRVSPDAVREKLRAAYRAFRLEQVKSLRGMPKPIQDGLVNRKVLLEPAPAGVSDMQEEYRLGLVALGILVALVLLIACANVANVMLGQATARAREMALRVAIGAGRSRLVQLVLVESAILALLAASLGAVLAWWSAPFVLSRTNLPGDPARLLLPIDCRVTAFGVALTFVVALLFGLAPAVRASAVSPANALKGGQEGRSRRRLMHVLLTSQIAFCCLVLFVAGLLLATFQQLTHQPLGFSADRLLTLETTSPPGLALLQWEQALELLRATPGVEAAALADWPLLSEHQTGGYISLTAGTPVEDPVWFLDVSPRWLSTMGIPLRNGRDFRPGDVNPKVAIVNEIFAKRFFNGENPLGKTFRTARSRDTGARFEIVGVAGNARYPDLRGPIPPVAYFPFAAADPEGAPRRRDSATFIVRTANWNPLLLASALRRKISDTRPEFHVTQVRTQQEIDAAHTFRERLLAMLALFFGTVALLLAGIGLYGVLHYSVAQRRREIAIRMAVGARASDLARRVTADVLAATLFGSVAGITLGTILTPSIQAMLYHVKATDAAVLALPSLAICAAALLAALPAVIRAVHTDPVATLRTE